MGWFDRFGSSGGGGPTLLPSPSPVTADVLTKAGWKPGRATRVASPDGRLTTHGFVAHELARRFSAEFDGLTVDVPIDGGDGLTGAVFFEAVRVARLIDAARDGGLMVALAGEPVWPIGSTGGQQFVLLLGESGRVWMIDLEFSLFGLVGETVPEAVECLCDGRNARVDAELLDDGTPTGQLITAGNERDCWGLGAFHPALVAHLPRASLSPARRPPTSTALCRVLQAQIAGNADVASRIGTLQVGSGGLSSGPDGQWYFVAHGENDLHLRGSTGVTVMPAPVRAKFRPGERVPCDPPPGVRR